jgi:hypothetical protein
MLFSVDFANHNAIVRYNSRNSASNQNYMSMATLERAILAGAKRILKNTKLKHADILEWSTGEVKAKDDSEIVLRVDDPGVNVCVLKTHDKR